MTENDSVRSGEKSPRDCQQCSRTILGESERLTVSVDESVDELPTGSTDAEFCSERCKQDHVDELLWPVLKSEMEGEA